MPDIAGSEILNDDDLSKQNLITTSLRAFMLDSSRHRLNAPYQRQFVWSQEMQKNLIKSIFANVPIGCFHLVKEEDNLSYNVLDAKQRLTTINNFMTKVWSKVCRC